MSLSDPFPVYGRARDSTGYISGTTVHAVDVTAGSSTISATTGTNGEYFLDLMTIATNGDTIQVWATLDTGETDTDTFTLDITGAAEEVNLYLRLPGAHVVRLGWVVAE